MTKAKRGTKKERSAPVEAAGPKESAAPAEEQGAPPVPLRKAVLAMVLAWLVPGAGHLTLGRVARAAFYFVWVALALAIGCYLDGFLPFVLHGSPLQVLKTLGAMGSGIPYFLLRFAWDYQGDLNSPGFDYGFAFLESAGLMNMLLVLDTWDIAVGRKT